MTFDLLALGAAVFLDANTLTYYFEPHPVYGTACRRLLERIERQELTGFTATHVLGELAHRLMTLEAMAAQGWPQAGIANRLRRHPAVVQTLTRFRQAVESLLNSRVQVLTVTPAMHVTAAILSQQTGLLTNDALIVAVMQHHGLTNLASNDADFDRIPSIARYAPA
jgi:predicted nucleic acid-binding protein